MDYLLIEKIGHIRHFRNWLSKVFIRKIGVVEWKVVWFMKIEEKLNRNHTADCKRVRPTRAEVDDLVFSQRGKPVYPAHNGHIDEISKRCNL